MGSYTYITRIIRMINFMIMIIFLLPYSGFNGNLKYKIMFISN